MAQLEGNNIDIISLDTHCKNSLLLVRVHKPKQWDG